MSAPEVATSTDPIRALLVAGCPEPLQTSAAALERTHDRLSVETETSLPGALDRIDDGGIDCVVSDVELPEADGLEFLRRVRAERPDLPFILYTAAGSEEIASDAISAGVTDYLRKQGGPERSAELADRIETAVDRHRAESERQRRRERDRELVEDSPVPIVVFTAGTELVYVNGAAVTFFDAPGRETLLGEPLVDVVHQESVDRARSLAKRVLDADEPVSSVGLQLVTRAGETRDVSAAAAPVTFDGEPAGQLVLEDVTERRERERELERYETMVNQASDLLYAADTDGRLITVNDAAASLIGSTPAELVGEPVEAVATPESVDRGTAVIADLVSDGTRESETFEMTAITADGEAIPCENRVTLLSGDDGEFLGHVGVVRDISERKERERELERYETIIETVPVGVTVLDEEATIEWVNEAFWSAIDRTEAAVTGRPFMELIQEGLVEADLAEDYLEAVRTLLSSDTDEDRVMVEFRVDPPHEEGVREYEGYIALRPLVDGEYAGTVNAFLDVTERKRRERQLEQYKAAMETVPDGVFLLDEAGTMTRVNQAWADAVGYEPEELNGEPFLKLVEDGVIDRSVVDEYLGLVPDLLSSETDRERGEFTTRVVPPDDDREHVYEVRIGLLPYEEEFQGAAGVVRDVTESVERRRELERENERLDEFASIVSHDLRNPLNVLVAELELAAETGEAEHFEQCRQAVDRMDRLIDNLLRLARHGDRIESVEDLSLSRVAASCWQTIDTADATLDVDSICSLRADEERLEQLLQNLFRNAIEHGGDAVSITVGALDEERGFYVADDGPGIPEGDRDRVFESGYSGVERGTGFGLSIVRQICEAHGWSCRVSESAEGGARFEIDVSPEAA